MESSIVSPVQYSGWTCSELVEARFDRQWLVDHLILAGQPLIVAGAKKTLKTSLLIDLALSLATSKPFLGTFPVAASRRVGLMTGESGLETIRETIVRIASAKGVNAGTVDGLVVTEDLPTLGDAEHAAALTEWLTRHQLDMLIVDPAYMCLASSDAGAAGNLFIIGPRLRELTTICRQSGVTMALCHHTKRNGVDQGRPAELEDIAWAGFQEFARQWLLLARRDQYQPGTGSHRLWLSAGGSAGHGGQWGLDIEEGTRGPGESRFWQVEIRDVGAVERSDATSRERKKNVAAIQRQAGRLVVHRERLLEALGQFPEGETQHVLKQLAGLNSAAAKATLDDLVKAGSVVTCEIIKTGRKKPFAGYRLVNSLSP